MTGCMTPGMIGGMANKGNPKVVVRFEPELLALVSAEVDRTNEKRRDQPFTLSAWLRQAAIDKLRHSARSRGASTADLAKLDAFPETGV